MRRAGDRAGLTLPVVPSGNLVESVVALVQHQPIDFAVGQLDNRRALIVVAVDLIEALGAAVVGLLIAESWSEGGSPLGLLLSILAIVGTVNGVNFADGLDGLAAGLLVIASYNWGERRIIKLIRNLPETPKERNFWRLLAK